MATVIAIPTALKNRKKTGGPDYLIYETLNGRALYYRGYRDVVAHKKKPAEIIGSSSLQAALVATLVMYLGRVIDRKRYLITTNESGIHLDKGSNLSNGVAIFDRSEGLTLTNTYFSIPPRVAIEVDVRIEAEEFGDNESVYVHEKTERLLRFGVERVIWIFTESKKIFLATKTNPWLTQNWDADVPVINDVVLNLAGLLREEGFEF